MENHITGAKEIFDPVALKTVQTDETTAAQMSTIHATTRSVRKNVQEEEKATIGVTERKVVGTIVLHPFSLENMTLRTLH